MSERKDSTIAALLEDRPKRGRPKSRIQRQNTYIALTQAEKEQLSNLAHQMLEGVSRADIPDLSITLLARRFDTMREAVADRNREIPEGITDLDSLYLLWDLPLSTNSAEPKWTSIRLSPQQVIDLGRIHGILNALFGVNRSQVFTLSLALLEQFIQGQMVGRSYRSPAELQSWMDRIYL